MNGDAETALAPRGARTCGGRWMRPRAAKLRKAGLRVEEKVLFGNRVEEIVKSAAESRADLIVLGSHKVDLRRPGHGFGTISYKVGILAQCPVLLVK